jgi:hypothetical protein
MSFRKEQENSSITVHGKVGVVESAVCPDILGEDACDVKPLNLKEITLKINAFLIGNLPNPGKNVNTSIHWQHVMVTILLFCWA